MLKHEMDVVLGIEEWEHLNFHSQSHILYLLRLAAFQKHHSGWSQSDQIILLPLHIIAAGKITTKEGCVDPFNSSAVHLRVKICHPKL